MSGLRSGRVLLTGSTGFLGQAVLERLLSEHPGTEIVLLVRGRPGISADERLQRLLTKPVFRPWRDRVGADEVDRAARERIEVIEADVSHAVPDVPSDLAAVLHCASVVSFDPPVDEAFRTNLLGTVNLYEGIRRAAARRKRTSPHLVHVSTAYVAGSRGGIVPEAPLDHGASWRTELDWALAAREEVERHSRRPEVLGRAHRDAAAEHRKAGPQAVAAAAERRRRELVSERLVEYGRARARVLGWPDVYTLTKALGEQAAAETAASTDLPGGPLPLSIVRPAIVESALRSPYPGWIDGFKMADPVILAYGRGMLRYLAAIPDGAIDIVPVDYVVSAMLAVAAQPPPPKEAAYYHVGSGARNPLTVQRLYELVRGYFEADPLPDPEGRGATRARDLAFLSGERADRGLRAADRVMGLAERAVVSLPASERTQEWQRALHRRRDSLELMRRYRDLYGAYVQAEVVYADENTLALHRALPEKERDRFGFDTADIDWRHYLQDVHCPGITAVLRRMPPKRPPSVAGPIELPERDDVAAVFDLEGTVVASNVVEGYLWLRLLDAPAGHWPRAVAALARSLPRYLMAERRDRGEFLRAFLDRYSGADEAELRALARERLADLLLRRAWPQAVRRVRRHREAGHRTVLLTGALDIFVEPLRPLFDEVVGSRLRVVDGRCTGQLAEPPLVGESRAAWLRAWARAEGLDLSGSWAYGDHYSDRPVLELVGNPVAVNPDARLFRHAKQRRWSIERWEGNVVSATGALAEVAQ